MRRRKIRSARLSRGRLAAVGPHRTDITYACRKALPVVACYLSGPVAGFMHPGCRRGAGLVATGKSGADAGSVFASGGQAAVSAPCAWRLRPCGCRCHPQHLGPAAHRGGRRAGYRAAGKTHPPRQPQRWHPDRPRGGPVRADRRQPTHPMATRNHRLRPARLRVTGRDLAGAKPPPGAHHRSDVGLPQRRPHSWVAFNRPRSSGR
jgi:hypothetical protein